MRPHKVRTLRVTVTRNFDLPEYLHLGSGSYIHDSGNRLRRFLVPNLRRGKSRTIMLTVKP